MCGRLVFHSLARLFLAAARLQEEDLMARPEMGRRFLKVAQGRVPRQWSGLWRSWKIVVAGTGVFGQGQG